MKVFLEWFFLHESWSESMVRVWLHHSVSNEDLLKMKYFQVAMKPDNDGDEKVCELFLFIKTMV